MENKYYYFIEAVKESAKIIGDSLLTDGENMWDCFNIMDYPDSREEGGDVYWCVGYDGSIGYTEDNGYNVNWLLVPCDKCL